MLLSACWLSHDPLGADGPVEPEVPGEPDEPPVPEPDRDLRIAVVVDGSQSMAVSDPPSPVDGRGRVHRALEELVSARLPEDALLLAEASGLVSVLTQCDSDGDGIYDRDCYTRDAAEARLAIGRLQAHGLVESWSANVADVDAVVRLDLAEQATPATARWIVILITDEGGAVSEDAEDAATLVAALRADVERSGAGFVLSAVVLDTAFGGAGTQVAGPLVEAGGGSLQRVPTGEAIDLRLLVADGP